jgi:hypothetical protein
VHRAVAHPFGRDGLGLPADHPQHGQQAVVGRHGRTGKQDKQIFVVETESRIFL